MSLKKIIIRYQKQNYMYIPCIRTVFLPVGAFKASWSNVKIVPPAFRMRARAFEVTRRAQTYEIIKLSTAKNWIKYNLVNSQSAWEQWKDEDHQQQFQQLQQFYLHDQGETSDWWFSTNSWVVYSLSSWTDVSKWFYWILNSSFVREICTTANRIKFNIVQIF